MTPETVGDLGIKDFYDSKGRPKLKCRYEGEKINVSEGIYSDGSMTPEGATKSLVWYDG